MDGTQITGTLFLQFLLLKADSKASYSNESRGENDLLSSPSLTGVLYISQQDQKATIGAKPLPCHSTFLALGGVKRFLYIV